MSDNTQTLIRNISKAPSNIFYKLAGLTVTVLIFFKCLLLHFSINGPFRRLQLTKTDLKRLQPIVFNL